MKKEKMSSLRFTKDDLSDKGFRETSIGGKSLNTEAFAEARDGVRDASKRAAMKSQGKTAEHAVKGNPVRGVAKGVTETVRETVHGQINQKSDDNAGVEAANEGMNDAGRAVSAVESHFYSNKLKSSAQVEKMSAKAAEDGAREVSKGTAHEAQKQAVKKAYAKGKHEAEKKAAEGVKDGAKKAGKSVAEMVKKATETIKQFVATHPVVAIILLVLMLIVTLISGVFSGCTAGVQNTGGTIITTSYTAEDDDILGANDDYIVLQQRLVYEIRNTPTTHPGYDEYRYDLDEIGHNPYHLTSYLTALREAYLRGEVSADLQELFDRQYTLTREEVIEIRKRTETRTGTRQVYNPETDEYEEQTYQYDVEVEYEYKILITHLRNKGTDAAVRESGLSVDDLERYEILNETKGNREYLFAGNIYVVGNNVDGLTEDYRVPGEALSDARFAAMIAEAEKYLGMEYVWAGSSPATGFDCSGFVCWVINHSGNGNVGRTSAEGLRQATGYVSRDDAKPGDLIFFQGTYGNGLGASHVGIYVGNGMMIHCGNPISYASVETTYWQNHFLGFGRLE